MRFKIVSIFPVALLLSAPSFAQELPRTPVEATTTNGDKVLLHPNGRWEFVDRNKSEAAKKVSDQYPENKLRPEGGMVGARPEGAQGGLFGVGRTILPGDKDYNRGSLNPKMR